VIAWIDEKYCANRDRHSHSQHMYAPAGRLFGHVFNPIYGQTTVDENGQLATIARHSVTDRDRLDRRDSAVPIVIDILILSICAGRSPV
jgi:hypothetical protein